MAQNGTPMEQFLPKLCCSWLPTNYHLKKREGIPDECPLCQQSETNEHLFVCPKRRAQRKLFIIQFQGLLIDLRTDPKIQKELIDGIKKMVRKTDETPHEDHDNQPVSKFPAALQQEAIGWIHIYRGFLSTRWQEDQARYAATPATGDEKENQKQWNVKVIQYLWKYAHKTWIERCKLVHDKEGKRESEQARTRAEKSVTTMYRHQENVNAQDRANIFGRTLQDRLTDGATELSTWYETTLPALKRAIKDYRVQSRKGQTKINEGSKKKLKNKLTAREPNKQRAKPARRNSSGTRLKQVRHTRAEDNNAPT